jgi:transcriptional regulator with XRE-family HTH domain
MGEDVGSVTPHERRRLVIARRLRAARRAIDMHQAQLAAAVGVTQSMISKFETGRDTPTADMMVRLGEALGLPRDDVDQLVDQLAELAIEIRTLRAEGRRGQGWIQGEIGEHEAASSRLWTYQASLVPGLLQVPEYTAAMLTVMDVDPASHAALLSGRAKRQHILYDESREFRFLLTESVLRTRVAPISAMRTQLRRLLALDEGFSHIQVAVIPQARPLRRWAMTSFDVWGDMVSVELKRKEVRLREPEYVAMYVSLFEEMWAEAALGPELAALIRDADQWLASLPQER